MSVEIDGKTYSLVEVPSDKSDIVEAQKEYLLGAIKLDALSRGSSQHDLDLRFVPRVMLGTSISLVCHV